MDAHEIIGLIEGSGGHIHVREGRLVVGMPKGSITNELRAEIRKNRPELLRKLGDLNCVPIRDLEQMDLAIQIRSEAHGDLWLVSSKKSRDLVTDGNPVYSVQEAILITELPTEVVRLVHAFKRTFGGEGEREEPRHVQQEANAGREERSGYRADGGYRSRES